MSIPYMACPDSRISDLLRAKLFANDGKLAHELIDILIMRARNGSHKAMELIIDRVDGRFDPRPAGSGSLTLMFVSAPAAQVGTRACSSDVVDTGYEVRVLPSPQSQAQSQAQSQVPADDGELGQADDSEQAPLDKSSRTPTQ